MTLQCCDHSIVNVTQEKTNTINVLVVKELHRRVAQRGQSRERYLRK